MPHEACRDMSATSSLNDQRAEASASPEAASLPSEQDAQSRQRSVEEIKMRSELHKATRDHLIRLQLSNSEGFDRAILTLSSAGLALSITVVKDLVRNGPMHQAWSLQATWVLFALSIATVVVSYITSQQGIDDHLGYAHEYYEEGRAEFWNKSSPWRHWTIRLGYAGGVLFLLAIASLIWFSISNMI